MNDTMRRLRGWIKSICSQLLRWHAILVWKLVVLSGCVPQQRSFMTILLLTLHMHPHWHEVPSVERKSRRKDEEGLLSVPSNKQGLYGAAVHMWPRSHMCAWVACVHAQVSLQEAFGWDGWMMMTVVFGGISSRAWPQIHANVHVWMPLQGRETDRTQGRRESERQTERRW